MKKTLLLLTVFVVLSGGLYLFRFRSESDSNQILPAKAKNYTQVENNLKQIGQPVRLSIPSINVKADIEKVGLDEKRNMDVPKNASNVGWYNLGPKPGEVGSAVMAGHLDDPSGNPAVFWDLKKIKVGEEIKVTDENGEAFIFIVSNIKNYPWDDFPLQEVFADSSGKKLNLITCDGTFDKNAKNYSERTVVYSELKK